MIQIRWKWSALKTAWSSKCSLIWCLCEHFPNAATRGPSSNLTENSKQAAAWTKRFWFSDVVVVSNRTGKQMNDRNLSNRRDNQMVSFANAWHKSTPVFYLPKFKLDCKRTEHSTSTRAQMILQVQWSVDIQSVRQNQEETKFGNAKSRLVHRTRKCLVN